MEGHWETRQGAPLILFAIPDSSAETNHFEIAIPKLGSLILTHSLDGEVAGLKSVPPEDRPPVGIVFWSFRVMVGLGMIFIAVSLLSALQLLARSIVRVPAPVASHQLDDSAAVRGRSGRLVRHRNRPPALDHLRHPQKCRCGHPVADWLDGPGKP